MGTDIYLILAPVSCVVVPISGHHSFSYGRRRQYREAVVAKYKIAICGRKPWSVPIIARHLTAHLSI